MASIWIEYPLSRVANILLGVQKTTSTASEAGKITGIQLQAYNLYQLAFNDPINRNIDAVITDKILALSYVNKAVNDLKIAGNEIGIENYGILSD